MNDKNQAAIDHVTSVSKHPHATMIVKWLITGWKVEYSDDGEYPWNYTEDPNWHPNMKYRLIEPKPSKPAYRVYIEKSDGRTYTQDAINGNRDKTLLPEKYEWLSDWIEYDPPKKWPTPLVERIAAIDIKAAQWIVDHWDDLLEDKYTYKNNYSRDCDTLTHMFDWEAAPQGLDYWGSISDKLGE